MQSYSISHKGSTKITEKKNLRVDEEIFFSLCQLLIETTYLIRIESFNLRYINTLWSDGLSLSFFFLLLCHPSVNVKERKESEREKKKKIFGGSDDEFLFLFINLYAKKCLDNYQVATQ